MDVLLKIPGRISDVFFAGDELSAVFLEYGGQSPPSTRESHGKSSQRVGRRGTGHKPITNDLLQSPGNMRFRGVF